MDTNRYFSFSRLGMVMKRDWMENWKYNLGLFGAAFLPFLVVYLFNMADFNNPYVETRKEVVHYIDPHTASFVGITSFLFFYFAAEIMRNMRTKETRLSYLMLPATLLEKFVSRVIYVTVVLFVVILGASLLAEAVHWAFMPFFDGLPDKFKVCVWPEVWEEIGKTINPFQTRNYIINFDPDLGTYDQVERSVFFEIVLVYWIALWFHSLFILGGNYFGKYAFFKTSGVIILVGIVLGYVISHADFSEFGKWFADFVRRNEEWLTESVAAGIAGAVTFCFVALNWWLSYKLFTRRQVIEPKFRLL